MNGSELPLRDIHLPAPVSWWPPAVGWWLVAALALVVLAAAYWWWLRRKRMRTSPATLARIELQRLRTAWTEHGDTWRLARDISTWLRRTGMSLSSRRQAASLTGDQWQRYLDELAGQVMFSNTPAGMITELPYSGATESTPPVDGNELLDVCERWLTAAAGRVQTR